MNAGQKLLDELRKRRLSEVAATTNIPVRTLNSWLNQGVKPPLDKSEALAAALNLEFYIGPPRTDETYLKVEDSPEISPEISVLSVHEQVRDDLLTTARAAMAEMTEQWRRSVADAVSDHVATIRAAAETAPQYPVDPPESPSHQAVLAVELATTVGAGATELDETVIGHLWFRRDWLIRHAIDAARSVVVGVRGKSMEPLLPDGCSILVDRSRVQLVSDKIYLLRTDSGLLVKRLRRMGRVWALVSDHPEWPPLLLPTGAEIMGRVMWMAKVL